jgi:F420-0:gamma-glutamyl ligase-like protein
MSGVMTDIGILAIVSGALLHAYVACHPECINVAMYMKMSIARIATPSCRV